MNYLKVAAHKSYHISQKITTIANMGETIQANTQSTILKTKVIAIAITLTMVSCKKPAESVQNELSTSQNTTVVEDTLVGTINETESIQLINKHVLSEKELYADYDGGSQLSDFFVIELIDKDTFVKNQASAVNHFIHDTTSIQKNKGVLRLPCSKGSVTLSDNLSDGDNHKEYSYLGQISSLEAYLVSGIYWEDWNYFLIDKNGGRTLQTFPNFPYLSPNQDFIVSIDIDMLEGAAFIDLYEVNNKRQIDPMIGMYVKNWIPMGHDKIYWSSDNYLYIGILNNQDYWASEGNYTGLDQYIRLRPIA